MSSYWQEQYEEYCKTPSDINEHLPTLYRLASEPDIEYIVEFGVGYGRSTRAFLAAMQGSQNVLNSFEMKLLPGVQELFDKTKTDENFLSHATLHLGNLLEYDMIDLDCDLLLVDSHHTYDQVINELKKFGNQVTKYIVFHDTETFGITGQDSGSIGIMPAINEFLQGNRHWRIKEQYYNNNGLIVIQRS